MSGLDMTQVRRLLASRCRKHPSPLASFVVLAVVSSCAVTLPEEQRDAAHEDAGRAETPSADAGRRSDAVVDVAAARDAGTRIDGTVTVDAITRALPCAAIPGARYEQLSVMGPPTDRPAAVHGDLNLLLRRWEPVAGATRGLIDIDGPTDALAPRLNTLFTDNRVPIFSDVYHVQLWDWGCNCPTEFVTSPSETQLVGMQTAPGEVIEMPTSGYDIGAGFAALVLYATDETITLKVTREDNIVRGYGIHVAGICVEPSLQEAYRRANLAGRRELPAVRGNQPIGRARGTEIQVAVRDTGSWMDPRTRKDWWPH